MYALFVIPNANSYFMRSFDVLSLYTNVPVVETIDIHLDRVYSDNTVLYEGLQTAEFK